MSANTPPLTPQIITPLPFNWRVVGSLLFLFGIPGIPAIFIVGLVVMGTISPSLMMSFINAEYYQTPIVIIVHGLSGALFFLTMPFQFATRLRVLKPRFHRINGYVACFSGCVMGASGIGMYLVFATDVSSTKLFTTVMVAMAICFSFFKAISYAIKRNIRAHQRWIYFATAACLAEITPIFFDVILLLGSVLNTYWLQMMEHVIIEYGRMIALFLNILIAQWFFTKSYKNKHAH